MSNVKTITLTGEETKIEFDGQQFMAIWIQNLGSGTVYASMNSDISPDSDGVIVITAGNAACVSLPNFAQIQRCYAYGNGKIQVVGTGSVDCPFKIAGQGGGGGGGTGGVSTYAELPDKPEINSVPLSGNKSLTDLGIIEVSHETVVEMIENAKHYSKAEQILSQAKYRAKYADGGTYTNEAVDTGIPQSDFENGMTAVYKINFSRFDNSTNGLLGNGLGQPTGYYINLTGEQVSITLPCHGGYIDKSYFEEKIGETIVLIISSDENNYFAMINGVNVPIESIADRNRSGSGNLILLSSRINGIDNYFNGVVYDLALFTYALSESEAVAVTKGLN